MPVAKLLLPLDGSALSERTLRYVPLLAQLGNPEVRLVAVVQEYNEARRKSEEDMDRDRRLLKTYLAERETQLTTKGISVESSVLIGSPATVILEEALRSEADLIAISTHGRSGIDRWRLGSVADKVVRGASCNTLVIGPHVLRVGAEAAITRVLIPLDGSDLAAQALPIGWEIARTLGARVHVLRVVSPPQLIDDGSGYSYYPEVMESLTEEAHAYLKALKTESPPDQASVLVGPPATLISHYAERHGIDLIVMTSHGHGGLLRMAIGSVTDRMLVGPAPVLVVRPKAEL